MRVGILGSGLMGNKLGTIFARAGHEVVFSYVRSQKKLEGVARDAGRNARVGAPGDAAEDASALLLTVHWSRMDDVLKRAGDLWGKRGDEYSLMSLIFWRYRDGGIQDNSGVKATCASLRHPRRLSLCPQAFGRNLGSRARAARPDAGSCGSVINNPGESGWSAL